MTSKKRFLASITAAALLGGSLALGSYHFFFAAKPIVHEPTPPQQSIHLTNLAPGANEAATPSMVQAAQVATPAVVHIKATYETKVTRIQRGTTPIDQFFKEFFGEELPMGPQEHKRQPQQAAGSGVIIDADGYIVTNNHVINGADQIEVTLDDNRRYTAKLIGQDANTDLALLQIEEKGLPHLLFGNSDTLQVGEWVLAVGNPFNLTSTVTKGIVSAKSRNINLRNKGVEIESFIQTDAAVNSGNSGGALVNLKGELVGINTAISAPTGTFAGYAFAIPSSIVKKITDDLKKYGTVQRALLGIMPCNVTADLAKEKGLTKLNGAYIEEVIKSGAAAKAGIRVGDVIVAINSKKIKNEAELREHIARYKPKDKIRVTFYRKSKERTVTVILKAPEITNEIALGGATFENLLKPLQGPYKGVGGVRLKALKEGPWKQAGIQPEFIIMAIDNESVKQVEQLKAILKIKKKAFLVDGFYPGGKKIVSYAVDWSQQ